MGQEECYTRSRRKMPGSEPGRFHQHPEKVLMEANQLHESGPARNLSGRCSAKVHVNLCEWRMSHETNKKDEPCRPCLEPGTAGQARNPQGEAGASPP